MIQTMSMNFKKRSFNKYKEKFEMIIKHCFSFFGNAFLSDSQNGCILESMVC